MVTFSQFVAVVLAMSVVCAALLWGLAYLTARLTMTNWGNCESDEVWGEW
jgi:uncharacterized membrane protein YciS (DUF1049 family)